MLRGKFNHDGIGKLITKAAVASSFAKVEHNRCVSNCERLEANWTCN